MWNAQRLRKGQPLGAATVGCVAAGFLVFLAGCPGTTPPPPTPDPCADVTCADDFTCDATTGECVANTTEPPPSTGDAEAGQTFYMENGCNVCHGDAAEGIIGPSLVGVAAEEVFERNSGAVEHPGGTVDGITQQDADDVAAWLASL